MAKVLVTQEIPEIGIDMLKKAGHHVKVLSNDGPVSHQKLVDEIVEVDAVISVLSDILNETVFEKTKRLKIVANYAVGYDNIDLEAAKNRSIIITNTPGVLTEAVAEHTLALIFALAKHIVPADKFVKDGHYAHWMPMGFLGDQLWGKTLAIVGLGRIGSFLAEICFYGLKMKIIYTDVKRDDRFEMELQATYHELDTVLKHADIVSVNVPLLPSTYHMISKKEFSLMKPNAVIINTARGPIIDEAALVNALKEKQIAGAGLDVFEFEPKVSDELKRMDNVILTPHIASATTKARNDMAEIVAKNVIAVLDGKKPLTPVTL